MFTKVLPDDNPKSVRYSTGWSNDKFLTIGIDFIIHEGNEYTDNATNALDTINSLIFLFIDLATKGRTKTSCKK